VLEALVQLLLEPNADDPLEPKIAEQLKKDPQGYNKSVADWIKKYGDK
jgi:ubiquitin-protein ligase